MFSVPVRYRSGTVPVRYRYLPVFTLKYRYRTGIEPVPVPNRTEPGIFGTGTGTHF
ncbi:hypothetical protein HanRHA438_Chr04g0160301 [Helianthus annuus]|nr:hypothetical protein HanRHA438_Chr04g0160301 [Helianthus annuus]